MNPQVWTAIAGGVGGIIKSLNGYFRVRDEEDFHWRFFLTTIVEGALAGIVMGYVVPGVPAAFFAGLGVSKLSDFNNFWPDYVK